MAIRRPVLSVNEARRLAINLPADESNTAELGGDAAEAPEQRHQGRTTAPEPEVIPFAAPLNDDAPVRGDAADRAGPTGYEYQAAAPAPKPVEKVQVFVSAALPAPGTSWIYDQLCREYTPAKALQMILRRALDDYETALEGGSPRKTPRAYPPADIASTRSMVQTSRMMPVNLLANARAHFDPLGLESDRVFGRKLATAALAIFFDKERKRSR